MGLSLRAEAILGGRNEVQSGLNVFGADGVGTGLCRGQPSGATQQIQQAGQADTGTGEQVDGRRGQDGPVDANLVQRVQQIGFHLGSFQGAELVVGADARVKGLVLLQAQGVVQIQVTDQHQGKDRLTGQVQAQQQADLLQRSQWIELGFVQGDDRTDPAQILESFLQPGQIATAKGTGIFAQLVQQHRQQAAAA